MLETAFSAAHTALVTGGHADLALLIARLTHGPAKALGLAAGSLKAGALADLVILDTKAAWTPTSADLCSKSGNNPLLGLALTGRVRATFVGGRQVFGS
jgi:dihydroorotase